MKDQLGHYQLVAELGRGGMGVVYKGYEASLNRYVAIKVLADALANDESVKERFLREARSMAALNDPHIIQIYFIGDDAGQTYFVMEFVDGESLGSLLKREGKLTPEQAARIIYQTAQGLSTAHDKGVIHRDIKPGNLMITSRGNIKVADFGIALSTQDFSKKLTSTGEFVGTPGYLSPEVCQGNPVDQRSDIFSLGIVLFECLAGRMPFTDESPLGLMLEVVKAEVPDVCSLNDAVDPELSRILSKMLAKDPNERYQDCQELCADLLRHPLVAGGRPVTIQTRMSAAAATMVGHKTPTSGQRPVSATTPTPQPVLKPTPVTNPSPATPAQADAAADIAQPAAAATSPAKRSSALPWAIAAIVLLGVAGAAFAFRDRIPMLQNLLGSTGSAVQVAANTPTAATPAPAPRTPAGPAAAAAGAAPAANASVAQAATSAPATPSPGTPAAATNATHAPTSQPAATVAAATPPPANDQSSADGGPAARASQVEPLKQLAAAQAAQSPQQVATASRPKPASAPPKPHVPTVAILAGGDSALSEPAQQAIENMLTRHGFHVVDQDTIPGVSRYMRGRPRFAEVLRVLSRHGRVDAVVFVHARAVGSQELTYYGQSSTLYTAQLGVRAYAVGARRLLGRGWTQQVNFTSLNASQKAHEAVRPMLQEVEDQLADYRPRGRRG